ncbi:MAG TPA: hypothetical protein VMI55_03440 [Thermoplasmata archaeon]|nr:hypothetical protein [Thermoplasmata archaeon]
MKVPCGGSIQAAINAAHPGSTLALAPCTYVQQLTVDKSINIVGAGAGKTIIQSPATLAPDAFGNPWTIELGSAATVTLSGFTLVVTLQCIQVSGLFPATGLLGYAGGGIGVGGSAVLNLQSAVVTTAGATTEGGSCPSGPGFMTYGTGVDFGLDYLTVGKPAANQLVGFGTVSGVTFSGFGYGGPAIAVGGGANSPAGSYALISDNRISTAGTTLPLETCPCAAGIAVGSGGNASSAKIIQNALGVVPLQTTGFPIVLSFGSYAYIAQNSITGGGWGDGITVALSSWATITGNSIVGTGATDFYIGIFLLGASGLSTITFNSVTGPVTGYDIALSESSALVEFNSVGQFSCTYDASLVAAGLCGPDFLTQYQFNGIYDASDPGLGTTIAGNIVFDSDAGIALLEGCSGCVVKGNTLLNSFDYGLWGVDGSYGFSQNLVVGGAYGVAATAYSVNTTVVLAHVAIVGPSVAPFYTEVDFTGGTATISGT